MEIAFNDNEDYWFQFHDTVFEKYDKYIEEGKAKLYKDMPKGKAEPFRKQMCIENRLKDRLPQLKEYYSQKLAQALILNSNAKYRIGVCNYKLRLIDKYLNKKKFTYKDTYAVDDIPSMPTPKKSKLKPILSDEMVIAYIQERLFKTKDEKFTKQLENLINEYMLFCKMGELI